MPEIHTNGRGRPTTSSTYAGFKPSAKPRAEEFGISQREISEALTMIMAGDITPQTAIAKYWEVYHRMPEEVKVPNLALAQQIDAIVLGIEAFATGTGQTLRGKTNLRKHAYIMAAVHYCPWSTNRSGECICEPVMEGGRCAHRLFED
jgi:hypothetical protein